MILKLAVSRSRLSVPYRANLLNFCDSQKNLRYRRVKTRLHRVCRVESWCRVAPRDTLRVFFAATCRKTPHHNTSYLAPQYLSELLQPVADVESRQRLRSSSTSQLVVPCMRRSTIGDRAFTVDAPRAWNSLPDSLHRLSSLEQFKKHLKTHLFKISFAQQDSLWL